MEIVVIIIIIWVIVKALSGSSDNYSQPSVDSEEPPPFKIRKKMDKFGDNDDDVIVI